MAQTATAWLTGAGKCTDIHVKLRVGAIKMNAFLDLAIHNTGVPPAQQGVRVKLAQRRHLLARVAS